MDIRVAITRTGVFIAVYTIVLGLPFAVAIRYKEWLITHFGGNWWTFPLGLMAALATVGPFIYIYVEQKAEARLLREQRRYQETLKQASIGMTRVRNLRKLLDLITHIVTKTVHIAYAAIYLYNEQTDEYVLQVSRDKGRMAQPKMSADNPLIKWIILRRQPLVYEEIKRLMQDSRDATYRFLEENMRILEAMVIIPSFLEDRFMGFIVLGEKTSGQIYTLEDLNVFQVLASQAALAIENAQFYEEAKEMQEQIAQAEKMATVGTMADGLSHQISNRFYALSLIAGDTIDTIKMTDTSKCTNEVRDMIGQINHALERIQANVMQGGEVVKGILKYTRKGEEGFEALTLDQVLDGTLEMVQYKVKLSEIDFIRDYSKDIPKIKGNLVHLEEVFFNLIDNAYDAIVERRTLAKEEGYRGKITVSSHPKNDKLEIIVEDNGMGIKDDQLKKIFTPFFTTKTSSRKGTGLGLYVINRIITDTHKGIIAFESAYKVGTRFIIELPVAG
jgi:signal transduction histidine kinase